MGLPDRPSKHEAFLALLREGWTSLHLDARRAGVVVPVHLRGEGHLVLQYGNDLPIPIPDLQVDDFGVIATLSFARSPQYTVVPWSAVYVVASDDGRGVLYHEDVPPDVSVIAREAEASSDQVASSGTPVQDSVGTASVDIAPRPSPTRALRAVPLGGHIEEAGMDVLEDPTTAAVPARRRKRPQLRLVK
jgi:stringent starvation protein B